MPLNYTDKQAIVTMVAEVASSAVSALVAHYRGLTVTELTELRKKAREANVYVRVVPNNLAKRATEGTAFVCLHDALVGPTILLFAKEDPGAAARVILEFIKTHKALEVKALALGGQLLAAEKLKDVADLPTYDQAVATLMSVLQAPVIKLARTLQETYAQCVRVTAAVRDQKREAA